MKLEDIIAQRLAQATADLNEGVNKPTDEKVEDTPSQKEVTEHVQVDSLTALLEQAGLNGDFALNATTIFEAAVNDRVMTIEQKMQKEFETQLAEAVAEIENDIDGFVTESVAQWQKDNEVAIKHTFKSQMNESLIDGLTELLKEHSVDISDEKADALDEALTQVTQLEESLEEKANKIRTLENKVNEMKAQAILESFRPKMTQTEFDRFTQLTSTVKYINESQYEKQLDIVHETFTAFKQPTQKTVVNESVNDVTTKPVITESNSSIDVYAKYISNKKI